MYVLEQEKVIDGKKSGVTNKNKQENIKFKTRKKKYENS